MSFNHFVELNQHVLIIFHPVLICRVTLSINGIALIGMHVIFLLLCILCFSFHMVLDVNYYHGQVFPNKFQTRDKNSICRLVAMCWLVLNVGNNL